MAKRGPESEKVALNGGFKGQLQSYSALPAICRTCPSVCPATYDASCLNSSKDLRLESDVGSSIQISVTSEPHPVAKCPSCPML